MKYALGRTARAIYEDPLCFCAAILVFASPTFIFDFDYFGILAKIDARHEEWMIDQLAGLAAALGLAFLIRQNIRLRQEARRRNESEKAANLLTRRDSLTGVISRRGLFERLDEMLARRAPDESFAVVMIDLDQFKTVNDVHGHAIGDEVLRAAVARMAQALGGAVLARLGGDEFVAVLPKHLTRSDIADMVDRVLTTLATPIHAGEQEIEMGASIGIAIAPQDATTASALLQAADTALFRAKAGGRGTGRFFEPAMDVALREQSALRADLRRAVTRKQIVPYYQPIADLQTGEVRAVEVLARWLHPQRGMVTPDVFIPMLQEAGLLTSLTVSLLKQVCRDVRHWPGQVRVSLNLSPDQLVEPVLAATLLEVIHTAQLDPCRFEIEITESALVGDTAAARAAIDQFRTIGMSLALDDFGTGHSGLSQLRDFRFDRVKLDKSFVRDVATNPQAAHFVAAITRLLSTLDLPVTAEGVEDPETRRTLHRLGCAAGQGYLFGRPVPGAELRFEGLRAEV